MAGLDLEHGLDLVEQRLGELRAVDADLVITWDARPDLPLCMARLCGVEVLLDPLHLLKRIDSRQPQPGHDDPADAAP